MPLFAILSTILDAFILRKLNITKEQNEQESTFKCVIPVGLNIIRGSTSKIVWVLKTEMTLKENKKVYK